MKKILFLIAAMAFGKAQAQTCEGTDPGSTAGATSCVTLTYDGATTQYTTVRAADGNVWMQQNLGSTQVATSATDAASYGDYYQWGRWQDGHEKSNSAMGTAVIPNNPMGVGTANNTFIPSWWNAGNTTDTWEAATPAAVSETNGCDPCKAALGNGWRVPTEAEWTAVIEAENITNVESGFTSNLKLAVAGYRGSSGSFSFVGQRGYYWNSNVSATLNNYGRNLYYSNAVMNPNAGAPRLQAHPIRCIKGQATVQPTPASLAISVLGDAPTVIITNGGTLQLLATITPSNASQQVTWSITSGNELATISSTGLVTATANGTVTVQAVSTQASAVFSSITITITNQVVTPTSVEVSTENNIAATIDTNEGTLQLTAEVLPSGADQNVTWSLTSGNELATIDANGLVTAIANGTVTAQAVSTVDAALIDTIDIVITGQYVAPASLEVTVENDLSPFIITVGGTLQLEAAILPAEASQAVTWSISAGNGLATIDANGLITAIADGVVTLQAASNDDATTIDTIDVTIINQNIASAAPYCTAVVDYDVEPISLVQFAGINNATSPEVNTSSSYENFTSITGSVEKGQTYQLIVEGNTVGLFAHDIRVFIDWNQDDSFDMATEYYLTSLENTTGTDGVQATLNITVPETALAGTTRMRITKDMWNVYEEGEFDACTNAYYGQVEDYSLDVTDPVAGIDDNNKTVFTVYPNPTNGKISIQAAAEVVSVEVYNLTGQRIAKTNQPELDLTEAASGMYMIKIEFASGNTATQKILKSN
ncbi:MAG: hypothetical protein DI539_13940 [Flavobacterium psychrophilum]|nr:MAG: hypothetical protein DI539_13940 [Flavobacterium psychrophilum]